MKITLRNQLFIIAVPMILSNITVPLLGLVDTAVLGHLDHSYYLGGSTLGAMVITIVSWLCGFLRMTTTGLSAQAYGGKDQANALLVLLRGLAVALFISLLFILLQTPYIEWSLSMSDASEQVLTYAKGYAYIRIWGLPAAMMNLVLLGWLLGQHRAKSVMWLLIATNLINLALDIIFVVLLDWKVAGVAYATVIAEYSALLFASYIAFFNHQSVIEHWQKLTIKALFAQAVIKRYFQLNRDILIRTIALQACFVFITFQGAKLGDDVVATNAILMNFLLFISFGLDGIANAAEVMVGKAKGAKKYLLLKHIVVVSLRWTLVFAALYVLVFAVAGQLFISMLTSLENVINYAEQFMPWIVLLPLLACWSYLFDGIYIGLTQAKVMRNSMLVSTFLCFFPAWWLLQGFGNHALWAAFSIFMIARGVTLGWDLKRRLSAL